MLNDNGKTDFTVLELNLFQASRVPFHVGYSDEYLKGRAALLDLHHI